LAISAPVIVASWIFAVVIALSATLMLVTAFVASSVAVTPPVAILSVPVVVIGPPVKPVPAATEVTVPEVGVTGTQLVPSQCKTWFGVAPYWASLFPVMVVFATSATVFVSSWIFAVVIALSATLILVTAL